MSPSAALPGATDELHPHLLFRTRAEEAEFATWQLDGGPQSLAIFTTAETAGKYQSELADSESWQVFQPPRDKLIVIFESCLAAGIGIAVLDPLDGGGRTLFDLAQVLQAAKNQAKN